MNDPIKSLTMAVGLIASFTAATTSTPWSPKLQANRAP